MTLEKRIAAIEARLAALEGRGPIVQLPPPDIIHEVIQNDDGSISLPAVDVYKKELLTDGDSVDREFAEFIPDKFIVWERASDSTLPKNVYEYIRLNVDRANAMLMGVGGNEDDRFAFSWIVHPVKEVVGFFGRKSYEHDLDAPMSKDTLAYPANVKADSILSRIKTRRAGYRRERIVDSNDFSPKGS